MPCRFLRRLFTPRTEVVMSPEEMTPTDKATRVPPDEFIKLYDETVIGLETDLHELPLRTRLTEHFTFGEMIVSQAAARNGFDNVPPYVIFKAGVEFARELLEPLRDRFGPVYSTSWFRSHEVNTKIGGSESSAHMLACAMDHTTQVPLQDEMAWWIDGDLPFDQVIYEYGGWIHVGGAKPGYGPRREALMTFRIPVVPEVIDPETGKPKTKTEYFLYDANRINARGDGVKT